MALEDRLTATHMLDEAHDTRLTEVVLMCVGALQAPPWYTEVSPLDPATAARIRMWGRHSAHLSTGGSAEPAALQLNGSPGLAEISVEDAELPTALTAWTVK